MRRADTSSHAPKATRAQKNSVSQWRGRRVGRLRSTAARTKSSIGRLKRLSASQNFVLRSRNPSSGCENFADERNSFVLTPGKFVWEGSVLLPQR
jgi:hypothetical protein